MQVPNIPKPEIDNSNQYDHDEDEDKGDNESREKITSRECPVAQEKVLWSANWEIFA